LHHYTAGILEKSDLIAKAKEINVAAAARPVGRGLHWFPFLLNLSLLFPFTLNLS
jgi:hypothetical protein